MIQVKVLNCTFSSITAIIVSLFSTCWAPQMRSEMTTEKNPHKILKKKIHHPQYLNYTWITIFLPLQQITVKWSEGCQHFCYETLAIKTTTAKSFYLLDFFSIFQVKVSLKLWSVLNQHGSIRSSSTKRLRSKAEIHVLWHWKPNVRTVFVLSWCAQLPQFTHRSRSVKQQLVSS